MMIYGEGIKKISSLCVNILNMNGSWAKTKQESGMKAGGNWEKNGKICRMAISLCDSNSMRLSLAPQDLYFNLLLPQ